MGDALRGYRIIAGSWIRASLTYRASFVTLTLTSVLITFLDFAIILVMFSHLTAFGGFSLSSIAVIYGMSGFSLGMADLLLGNTELVGRRVRDGSLDSMLVRPVPTLVQLAADHFALRRMGRVVQAVGVLGWGVATAGIGWTPARVAVLAGALVTGSVIFCSIFVMGGAFQVFAGDASEVANAFTYGGNTLGQYPFTIYPADLVKALTFILPMAFINWYPALYVLGRPDPFGFPEWLQWASPVVTAGFVVVAGCSWRAAIRRYRSTGS